MGEDAVGVDIDVEGEVGHVGERVADTFVHAVLGVADKFDVGAVGDDVFGRIIAGTRALVVVVFVVLFPFDVVEGDGALFFEVDLVGIEQADGGRDDGGVAGDGVPAGLDVEVIEVGADIAFGVAVGVVTLKAGLGGDGSDPNAFSSA